MIPCYPCPECGAEKPSPLTLSLHRRVMHAAAWKAKQDAVREQIRGDLMAKLAAGDDVRGGHSTDGASSAAQAAPKTRIYEHHH